MTYGVATDKKANATMERDIDESRQRMIDQQLKLRGITNYRVLDAMDRVPREEFVPLEHRDKAYDDCALPIAERQTISQPYTVAFMCQALHLKGTERVLEIGTGSGYGAAVLSLLAKDVYTIERIAELSTHAAETLKRLGYDNVMCGLGDGSHGWPEQAPFDAIVATASSPVLPEPYKEQLTDGGRIVIPIGATREHQAMMRFTLHNGEWTIEDLGYFVFVPLIGSYGWSGDPHT
ncbi:MAG: protein-L-isoaspartate(D-aspartate) O-methyltransferase [Planctomycetota bacterium]|nr:protein-L-isoaspartate(D-aspartate) O-methyltransferase [Planctomycetota bacterium]MDA1213432.1 protein-L-isoaspartate(D-aspartate) O-methyltransferase [Planctomycetota bacterium]